MLIRKNIEEHVFKQHFFGDVFLKIYKSIADYLL